MNITFKIEGEVIFNIENRLKKECKRLDKYFFSNLHVTCKIVTLPEKFSVKISVDSNYKHFVKEERGEEVGECISRAVQNIIKMIAVDKEIATRRSYPTSSEYVPTDLFL